MHHTFRIFVSVSIYADAVEAYYGTRQISGTNPGAKTKGCKDTEFSPIDEEKLADGKYTFTKKEDGTYEWHLVQDDLMEASLDDIANWIASGIPNRNIETRYLNYLRRIDPELYEAAKTMQEIRLEQTGKTGGIF